jgi:hypothetical protein
VAACSCSRCSSARDPGWARWRAQRAPALAGPGVPHRDTGRWRADLPVRAGGPRARGAWISHRDYLLVAVLAVFAALTGLAFKAVLYRTEDLCDRIWGNRPEWARPAAGGIVLGLLLALPQLYGVGYPVMDRATAGDYALWFVLLLAFGKIAATSLSIGIGGRAREVTGAWWRWRPMPPPPAHPAAVPPNAAGSPHPVSPVWLFQRPRARSGSHLVTARTRSHAERPLPAFSASRSRSRCSRTRSRRSSSVVPPHTPYIWCVASANCRH